LKEKGKGRERINLLPLFGVSEKDFSFLNETFNATTIFDLLDNRQTGLEKLSTFEENQFFSKEKIFFFKGKGNLPFSLSRNSFMAVIPCREDVSIILKKAKTRPRSQNITIVTSSFFFASASSFSLSETSRALFFFSSNLEINSEIKDETKESRA
jgi:hypothetical protein